MEQVQITIRETAPEDLDFVVELWNNGEVMKFVGYPDGLGVKREEMDRWLSWVINKPARCNYSIYEDSMGYCGETFYNVDETGLAALDIKLLPKAQGKGIASQALRFAIDTAFLQGNAQRVYVEPHPANQNAWRLYERLGFQSKPRPAHLEDALTYLEITREQWLSKDE